MLIHNNKLVLLKTKRYKVITMHITNNVCVWKGKKRTLQFPHVYMWCPSLYGRRFSDLQTASHHVPGPLLSTIHFSSNAWKEAKANIGQSEAVPLFAANWIKTKSYGLMSMCTKFSTKLNQNLKLQATVYTKLNRDLHQTEPNVTMK
jgi:hypothetical protein